MEDQLTVLSISVPDLLDRIKRVVREELVAHEHPLEPEEQLMSRREAAEYLGISLPTLRERTRDGSLKAYRLGRHVVYRQREILSALKPQRFSKSLEKPITPKAI
jgi:excisionase family DNA binding protein